MIFDDIAAISTPPGEGGIAIIRVTGQGAIEKIDSLFKPHKKGVSLKNRPGYTLTLGWIIHNQQLIDQVLVSIMRAPRSYTGEDVVEINCHGGILPARRCLEVVMQTGIRLAEPGEFTRRAFLNGRLDVSQAEAVIDIIRARSEKSMSLALKQLAGQNSQLIYELEEELIAVNALVEASMDFPDEVGDLDNEEVRERLQTVLFRIEQLIEAGKRAEVYRDGINIAIVGKPNVGKSSLLNALLRKDRAIVTEIPGTTRDVIEDYIKIKGIPVKLMDTAGIRATDDLVERIGVEKTQEVIKHADLVIFLLDVGSGITEEDLAIYKNIENRKIIILVNKEDLEEWKLSQEELPRVFSGVKIIRGSVKEEIGLEELEDTIEEMVLSGKAGTDGLEMMLNMRQKNALVTAKSHIQAVLNALGGVSLDCLGVDLWGALEALGDITGKNLREEVIDRIFHDFCIGK